MTQNDLIVKMNLNRWYASVNNMNQLLDTLVDEQLEKQVSPGRNSGKYLLGHLIAVHDDMLEKLCICEKQYPELSEPFLQLPDGNGTLRFTVSKLKDIWKSQSAFLNERIASLSFEEWFSRHSAVSPEDFLREPHRNKLNILITRTTHLAYHTGQMVLLK